MWWKEQLAAIIFDWYWLTNRSRLVQFDLALSGYRLRPFDIFVGPNYKVKFLISNYYLIIKK